MRDYYSLASSQRPEGSAGFPADAKDELQKAGSYWQRYSKLAENPSDTPSYLRLVSYAARAGDTRTADLAGQKAVDLAPKDQKKLIKKQIEALKKASQGQQPSG